LKPAAGGGKNVRRKVGQDGLLLHNYNYRTSAGFPSPVSPENRLNPVPFRTDPIHSQFVTDVLGPNRPHSFTAHAQSSQSELQSNS
jgi:hypothetical protein